MSVYRRKSGRWAVLVDVGRGLDQKRKRRTQGTYVTRKEAERAERRALDTRDRGIDLDPKKVSLGDVAERFLKSVVRDLSPITVARYEEHWRMHVAPTLGGLPVASLKPAHLVELYTGLRTERVRYQRKTKSVDAAEENFRMGPPLGPNTVLRVHRFLHRLLGWAERMNLVVRNVARSVDAPKASPSPARALTVEQVALLLSAADGARFYPFFALAIATGMRRGEIGALTWDDVDLDNETVMVRQAVGQDRSGYSFVKSTKTGRERVVPLNGLAISALKTQRASQAAEKLLKRKEYEDQGLVFADELGRLLDLDAISKSFAALARGLGIKRKGISLHSCRHFGATQALAAGSDVRTVAALLGHASASTTLNVYGHVIPGAQERAVAQIDHAIAVAQARKGAAEK
ncbi:MAG: tyrosine-type recombinase/integrase [Candidatus Cybelea sp.]